MVMENDDMSPEEFLRNIFGDAVEIENVAPELRCELDIDVFMHCVTRVVSADEPEKLIYRESLRKLTDSFLEADGREVTREMKAVGTLLLVLYLSL